MTHDCQVDSPAALTIAGSDSGGGAGIQADLHTFAALGVFGTSAITCVTAQNPDKVAGVEPIAADMVALQIRTVCEGFPVSAAKTGMLFNAEIIGAVARAIADANVPHLVVDPVMVATSGARLLEADATVALQKELLPRAEVVTPNIPEAEVLGGGEICSEEDMAAAARAIAAETGSACVVKGGHLNAEQRESEQKDAKNAERRWSGSADIVNVLCVEGEIRVFRIPRVAAVETHGTGCTFSAAVAAMLARGASLAEAVKHAGTFVRRALERAVRAGKHAPLGIWLAGPEGRTQ